MTGPLKPVDAAAAKAAAEAAAKATEDAPKKPEAKINSTFTHNAAATPMEEYYKFDNIKQEAIKNSVNNQTGSRECEDGNDKYVSEFGNGVKLETIQKTNSIDTQREVINDPRHKQTAEYVKTNSPECGITESFTYSKKDQDDITTETKIDYCNQNPAQNPWLAARGLGENPSEVHVVETRSEGEGENKETKNLVKMDKNKDGHFETLQYVDTRNQEGIEEGTGNKIIRSTKETRTVVNPDAGDTETKPYSRTLMESNSKTITPEGVLIKEKSHKFGTFTNLETGKKETTEDFASTTVKARNNDAEITTTGKFSARGPETVEVKKGGNVIYKGDNTPEVQEYYKRTTGIGLTPEGIK